MTQERFINLIHNPDLVSSISYEELKTLAFAYPYAHNLRYLLALKAQQEGHPESARMLQHAAAYSLDRTRLFMLVVPRKLTPPRTVQMEKEEILELKPIETVQRELEALATLTKSEKTTTAAAAEMAPVPAPAVRQPVSGFFVQQEEDPSEPDREEHSWKPEFQAFAQWFAQFHPPVLLPEPVTEALPAKRTQQPGIAHLLAEKSVSENKDVISETLARLLVRQGHREKAINMYERLRLAIPEKSAYFAAEIDKLKN